MQAPRSALSGSFDPKRVDPDKQRPDGSMKGSGWLGVHKTPSGSDVTEYSVGIEIDGKQMDIPTMVPGLTKAEVEQVITAAEYGEFPNRSVMDKAVSHARKMLAAGKSVYAPDNWPGLLMRYGDDS